jgi:hypothetical protein
MVHGEQGSGATHVRPPAFFAAVPTIVLHDPLAEMLGAAAGGLIEYGYADAVRLAGHSCPTVAGAWLMTVRALATLYPDERPCRGALRVELRQQQDDGVAGVIASVAGLITGAAGDGGFKGLAGRFARRELLRFGVPMAGDMRFTRTDNGVSVELSHHPEVVPRPPALKELMQRALSPSADAPMRQAFADAWQGWVQTMLLEHADDPALIVVRTPAVS